MGSRSMRLPKSGEGMAEGKIILAGGFLPEEQLELRPPEKLLVSEWADRHRVLDSATTAEPGPWRTERTAYLKAIMDTFCELEVEEVVFQAAVQVGKTETLLNILGYLIDQSPGPTMIVYPTVDTAEDLSRTRIQPMIDSHINLRRKKREDHNLFTTLRMQFIGMDLFLSGANSSASLSSKPIQNLFFDEVNLYPSSLGEEGDTVGIAMERTKTFVNSRKIFMVSTPTTKTGRITRELEVCDAVFDYFVPCPHCGEHQVLRFSQVKWPEVKKEDLNRSRIVEDGAYYECQRCHGTITDSQRQTMLKSGEWRTDNSPERVRKVGFRLSSLYSPWVSFGAMAVKFLESKDYPEKLQIFVNKWLGEPWEERTTRMESSRIYELRDDRPRGMVPENAIALTAGVDVQKHFLYYVIRGWSRDLSSWLIREGSVEGFEELETVLFGSTYPVVNTDERRIVHLTCVDSGFRTDEVYEWSRVQHGRVRPIKGATHRMNAPFSPTRIDYAPNGRQIVGGLTLWIIDTNFWKDALFRRMQVNPEDPGSWRVHSEIFREYAEQMVSENKAIIRNRKNGQIREEWQKVTEHSANHYWDCECYALAAAEMLGIRYIQSAPAVKTPQRRVISEGIGGRGWVGDIAETKNWFKSRGY